MIRQRSTYRRKVVRRKTGRRIRRGRRVIYGGSFWKKLKKVAINANKFLRKHKVLSKGIQMAQDMGFNSPYLAKGKKFTKMIGYGHNRRGGSLYLPGRRGYGTRKKKKILYY